MVPFPMTSLTDPYIMCNIILKELITFMKQCCKQASLLAQIINIHIISMIVTHNDRLPEKPIRPNIAGRLAKKFLNLKKKIYRPTCAQCRNTNRLVCKMTQTTTVYSTPNHHRLLYLNTTHYPISYYILFGVRVHKSPKPPASYSITHHPARSTISVKGHLYLTFGGHSWLPYSFRYTKYM